MQDLAHNRAGPGGAASAASQSAQAAKWAHLIVQRFVALTQINQVRLHWTAARAHIECSWATATDPCTQFWRLALHVADHPFTSCAAWAQYDGQPGNAVTGPKRPGSSGEAADASPP